MGRGTVRTGRGVAEEKGTSSEGRGAEGPRLSVAPYPHPGAAEGGVECPVNAYLGGGGHERG